MTAGEVALVDEMDRRALQMIYGREPPSDWILASATSGMEPGDWRRVALSSGEDPRDRCFAAWKVCDWSLWEQLYRDPTLVDWQELIGHFFPSRSGASSCPPFEIPAVSRDDYRFELTHLVRCLIRESDKGRCYWSDFKRRLPQLKHRAEILSVFKGRVYVTEGDLEQDGDRPFGGRYQVSGLVHEGKLFLMLDTSAEMNRRIVEDPHLIHFGRWHGFVAVATRGGEAIRPVPGNNIAWLRIDPAWRDGAWLIEEIVSYLVQACSERTRRLDQLDVFPELGAEVLAEFRASIRREFADWSDSAMCVALQTARQNGVGEIYLHTPEHFRASSNISQSLVTALYRDLPLRYGFERREMPDAAGASKVFWHRRSG